MKKFLAVLVISTVFSVSAFAARGSGHDVSTAGGISSPSATTSGLGENPAGLPYNTATSLTAAVLSPNDDFDPLTYGGLITLGNGRIGASVSLLRSNGGDNLDLGLGVGAMIEPLKTQFGVLATRALKPSGGSFDVDLGAIINSRSSTRLGLMAFGLDGGIDGYAAGIAHDPSSDVTVALDASYETAGKTIVVKPGLQVRVDRLSLSVGYGFGVSDSAVSIAPSIREEFSAGLAVQLSSSVKLEAYHEQLSRWSGFLSFVF